MDMVVKFKRVDTGKQWIAGNVKQGTYGPQIGMKKTPELQAYLDCVLPGGWINFNLYEPYVEKNEPLSVATKSTPRELNDEVPF